MNCGRFVKKNPAINDPEMVFNLTGDFFLSTSYLHGGSRIAEEIEAQFFYQIVKAIPLCCFVNKKYCRILICKSLT